MVRNSFLCGPPLIEIGGVVEIYFCTSGKTLINAQTMEVGASLPRLINIKNKKTRIPCIGLLSPSIGPPSPSIGGGRRSSNLQPPRRIHTVARQICRRREGGRAPERNHPYTERAPSPLWIQSLGGGALDLRQRRRACSPRVVMEEGGTNLLLDLRQRRRGPLLARRRRWG